MAMRSPCRLLAAYRVSGGRLTRTRHQLGAQKGLSSVPGGAATPTRPPRLARAAASLPPELRPAAASPLAPGLVADDSLARLSERAGFLPKPEAFDERLKPGFRGGKALLIFFLCNAVPFGALLYYLREQRAARVQLSLGALPGSPEEVVAEVLRVIRASSVCFLVPRGGASEAGPSHLRVDPHAPEATPFVPATEPLPLVPQLPRNDLTDIFESPAVAGLGFIHLAISRSSPLGATILAGQRSVSLLYVSHTRGAYCTVSGQASVLSDPESRRRYWKGIWVLSFPPPPGAAARSSGSRPPPVGAGLPAPPGEAEVAEAPPPWESPDYLLLRLAVGEATLQPTVDGPERWDSRRVVRKAEATGGDEGPKWALVAPAPA